MKKIWVMSVVSIMVLGGLFAFIDMGHDFSVDKVEGQTEVDDGVGETRTETWDYVHEMDTWDDSHHPSGWEDLLWCTAGSITHVTGDGNDGHCLRTNENSGEDYGLMKTNIDIGATYTIEARAKLAADRFTLWNYYDETYKCSLGVGDGYWGLDTTQWHTFRIVADNGFRHFYIDGELYDARDMGTYTLTNGHSHHEFWIAYTSTSGVVNDGRMDYIKWKTGAMHPTSEIWDYADEFNVWDDDHHPRDWATATDMSASYISHSITEGHDGHSLYTYEQDTNDDCGLVYGQTVDLGSSYTLETRAKVPSAPGDSQSFGMIAVHIDIACPCLGAITVWTPPNGMFIE